MKFTKASFVILAGSTVAFAPTERRPYRSEMTGLGAASVNQDIPFFLPDDVRQKMEEKAEQSEKASKASKQGPNNAQEGVLSPAVYFLRDILGDDDLNKLRGQQIALHSTVIRTFVDTAESPSGEKVLTAMFQQADKNRNGRMELEEFEKIFKSLGFSWLDKPKMENLFARAGGKDKGYITLKEWKEEAPKILKKNLVRLAKQNGGNLGLLV